MPVYTINYNSENRYDGPVFEAVLEFLVLPEANENQKLTTLNINTDPNTGHYISKNHYGFDLLRFRFVENIDVFTLNLSMEVEKQTLNPFNSKFLPVNEEHEILRSHDNKVENYYFLNPGPYTQPPENWEAPIIKEKEGIFDFCMTINELVYHSMKYDLNNASVEKKLNEVIESNTGVCQDFTHIMISMLRANNIPARYVSGYLNQGTHYQGSGAIHAWVEALIPEAGWIGFDPTNNLLEDHNYIKISHGVDLSECTSLKGVIKSTGGNSTDYHVQVKEIQTKQMNQ